MFMLEIGVFTIIYFKVGFFILNIFHEVAHQYFCVMRLYRPIKAKKLQGKSDDKLMIHS